MKFNLPKQLYSSDIMDFICDKKRDTSEILKKNINTIETRINRYQRHKESFHKLDILSHKKDLHESLLICYKSKTKKFKGYLKDIKDNTPKQYKNTCPYCGISEIGTVDHILPKDYFPEFSFLPINLIYVCAICNTKKSDDYKDGKKRIFVNPYIDDFLNNEFLKFDITFNRLQDPPIDYKLMLDYTKLTNASDIKIIKKHFKSLKLKERIEDRSIGCITRNYNSIIRQIENGNSIEYIKMDFLEEAVANAKVYGINHYETTISRALGTSNFVNDLYKDLCKLTIE